MATQFDLKTATPDATFPSGAFLFGADSQSASDPSVYSSDAYLSYILTKTNSWTGAQTFTLQTTIPVGSLGTPSIVFAGSPNAGLYSANAGNVDFAANGAWIFRISNGSGITAESGSAFNWSNTGGNPSATKDTGLSRVSAGVVGIGTGASGSVAGSLSGAAATLSGSAPQVTLGVNATTLGSIKMFGNTSGDVTLQPTAAAGTATTLTLPATTSTLAGLAIAQTFTATQTITPAANTNALAVSGFSLTGSNAQSLLDLAGTWNTSGTPTGIKLNITNTASNASSLLIDLQLSSSSVFRVTRAGHMLTTTFAQIDGFWGGGSSLLWVATSGYFSLGGNSATNGPILRYDADHTLAQRVGTNAQFHNIYATYTSATDYHRVQLGTAKTTLASVSGATVTATNIIPDGAIVVGVTTKVTVSLGTGGGTSGYQVGDGSDADRWGQVVGTAAGTSTDNTNWTATTVQAFTSAQSVVITADGGSFNGTGSIEVAVQYLIGQCD